MKKKNFNFYKSILDELIPLFSAFVLAVLISISLLFSTLKSQDQSLIEFLKWTFLSIKDDIYLSESDFREENFIRLFEKTIREKDKYFRVFFHEQEFKDFYQDLIGKRRHYGIFYQVLDNSLLIKDIIEHSPNKYFLKRNDQIVSINNESKVSEMVRLLKSNDLERLKLKVKRNNQILETEIVKNKIEPLYCEKVSSDTYRITIYGIQTKILALAHDCLLKIKDDDRVKKIEFDLRYSPGGSVRVLSALLSFFIDKNKLLFYEKTKKGRIDYYSTEDKLIDLSKYSISILKSRYTASASEVFIAVLKYYYPQIKLIGEKTYGKFTSVEIVKFPRGAIALSVGKLYLPNGETYEAKGL